MPIMMKWKIFPRRAFGYKFSKIIDFSNKSSKLKKSCSNFSIVVNSFPIRGREVRGVRAITLLRSE